MGMIKRPMKGAAIDDLSVVRFPVLASPKIDGFRCVLGKHAFTSRLSPFPNRSFHRATLGLLPDGLLDSEAVVGKRRGPGVLGRTSSGLTSRDGDPDWRLWVFDMPIISPVPFKDRLRMAELVVRELNHPQVRFLQHKLIHSLPELEQYLEKCLRQGFEGIMVRDPTGLYKEGKSTINQGWLLKVKPFEDAEGRVIGWFEEMENTNEAKREATGKLKRSSAKSGKVAKGRLGGLLLRDVETGEPVRVGGGFTLDQRIGLWSIRGTLLDKLVRYKKQKMGQKDKPRHPNFLEFVDFRPEWDFSEQ